MWVRWIVHTTGAFDFPSITLYRRVVYHKFDRQFDREKTTRFEQPKEQLILNLIDLIANTRNKPVNLLVSFVLTPGEYPRGYASYLLRDC